MFCSSKADQKRFFKITFQNVMSWFLYTWVRTAQKTWKKRRSNLLEPFCRTIKNIGKVNRFILHLLFIFCILYIYIYIAPYNLKSTFTYNFIWSSQQFFEIGFIIPILEKNKIEALREAGWFDPEHTAG